MARLYANENFPLPVVEVLRELGHDVLTTSDSGHDNAAIPDDAVLRFAREQDRTLITLNRRDFIKLHRQSALHSSIVVCTVDSDFKDQAKRIHDAVTAASKIQGELLRVNRPA